MSEACEDRDGRAGGATMLQPVILRLTLNAAAFVCMFRERLVFIGTCLVTTAPLGVFT